MIKMNSRLPVTINIRKINPIAAMLKELYQLQSAKCSTVSNPA